MRNNQSKLNSLLKIPQNLFHTQDLAILWHIKNKNTLHTTITRYVQKGILIRIHKGFYSKIPLNQVNPIRLGISHLNTFAYLSTESILARHGVISQFSSYYTLISNTSKKFQINNNLYIARQMKDLFLLNNIGIIKRENFKEASLERAVADMLYYDSHYHFDVPRLINWQKVKKIQKKIKNWEL